MLVLSGCVWLVVACACLAAETAAGTIASHGSPGIRDNGGGRLSFHQASQQLRTALASEPSAVKPDGFDAPPGPSANESHGADFVPQPGELTQAPGLAPDGEARIPFTPGRDSSQAAGEAGGPRTDVFQSVVTIGSSLAIVLGLFLVVVWAMRRAVPGASAMLPGEVVEVLGRSVLAGREQLHLLRCGSKLLLVSVSQTSVTTLTEITEPDEVDRLAGLCRQSQPGSATVAFRQVFEQLAGQRSASSAGAAESNDRAWEGHDV